MPKIPPVSYPGVYVQEVSSTAKTIVGVSTSIAVFIGRTKLGPLNKPKHCQNYEEFERTFSSAYSICSSQPGKLRPEIDIGGSV